MDIHSVNMFSCIANNTTSSFSVIYMLIFVAAEESWQLVELTIMALYDSFM